MRDYSDFLKDLDDFRDDYKKDLRALIESLKSSYVDALKACSVSSAQEGFLNLEDSLEKAISLSNIGTRIKNIKKLNFRVECELIDLFSKTKDTPEKEKKIDNVLGHLNGIISSMTNCDQKIVEKAEERIENIRGCPYGQEENCVQNALSFEQNVIEFISWLFIDEIMIQTNDEIYQKELIRDGVFKVERRFYERESRIQDLKVSHVIVECKNYRKPSHHDLMQVYGYTLLNRIFRNSEKPLCLVMSRENPSEDSITIKMQQKLFEKDRSDPTLILFLSVEDIAKMLESRKSEGGDPFEVLVAQMEKMKNINVTREY